MRAATAARRFPASGPRAAEARGYGGREDPPRPPDAALVRAAPTIPDSAKSHKNEHQRNTKSDTGTHLDNDRDHAHPPTRPPAAHNQRRPLPVVPPPLPQRRQIGPPRTLRRLRPPVDTRTTEPRHTRVHNRDHRGSGDRTGPGDPGVTTHAGRLRRGSGRHRPHAWGLPRRRRTPTRPRCKLSERRLTTSEHGAADGRDLAEGRGLDPPIVWPSSSATNRPLDPAARAAWRTAAGRVEDDAPLINSQ
jgi:hypothetical protein